MNRAILSRLQEQEECPRAAHRAGAEIHAEPEAEENEEPAPTAAPLRLRRAGQGRPRRRRRRRRLRTTGAIAQATESFGVRHTGKTEIGSERMN